MHTVIARTHALIDATDDGAPPGFVPMQQIGNFDCLIGQLWGRRDGDALVMGFRCAERHINAHGSCHGGMIASFADMMAYAARVAAGLNTTSIPTVTLSVDYLRPVKLGDWVEGRSEMLKSGKRLIFARILGTVEGVPVFSATSINVPGGVDLAGSESLRQVMGPDLD